MYCVVLAACFVATVAGINTRHGRTWYTPNRHEQSAIESCLRGQNMYVLVGSFATKCETLRVVARDMGNSDTLNRDRRVCRYFPSKGDSGFLELEYVKKLSDLKQRGQPSSEEALDNMLEAIAPCSVFSPSLRRKWKNFFDPRGGDRPIELITRFPVEHQTNTDHVVVSFTHPLRHNFSLHELIGVDLALLRIPPCQLNEGFGLYDVVVRKLPNDDSETEVVVHHSTQASCAGGGGYMMVASLDTGILMEWLLHEHSNLQLSVQVTQSRQIMSGNSSEPSVLNVLRRVLSLGFHLQAGPGASQQVIAKIPQGRRASHHRRRNSWITRMRRSPSRGIRGCERTSFPINFQDDWFRHHILYPSSVYDIGECVGRCDFPIQMPTNASNHALALTVEREFGLRSENEQPTICCVPTDYYSMYATLSSEFGVESVFLPEIEVKHCGCS
uniref:Transforming growth factor beta superfamily signaling ligand n=1 Tax=Ciona intestinalis TaxID=7719 RepID=A4PIG2_CIOIN|nr:transforming growth factor beta superfamily signaling ligand precursor [Ciona intestinalis]BAF49745.1 transforming growth factor beta superfamily signaling ligand [Ciona intestinalis]|eukprot:NP_001093599.1 transforming growth factor beta superfamily signaling ligand precursor [Ciona intestinalis]